MKKILRTVDEKRGIMQLTTADERYYLKQVQDAAGLPIYKAVPSVTWICSYYYTSPYLVQWIAKQGLDEAEAIKKAAGDKGSVVHKAIEMILNGEEFRVDTKVVDRARSTEQETFMRDLSYEELLCVKSFVDWKSSLENFEVIATETTVFSDIHEYAGTVDLVCRINGEAYVVDFKTSKQIWREHEIQISAYRNVLENGENPLEDAKGKMLNLSGLKTAILQVGYDKNKMGYKFTEIEDQFDLFLVAQQIWKREVGDNKPGFAQKDFPLVLSKKLEIVLPGDKEVEESQKVTRAALAIENDIITKRAAKKK